jgi:hypothetical protein
MCGVRSRRLLAVSVCTALAVTSFACVRHDRRIQQHEEALQSLGSTARAIAQAWLDGHISGTYTETALQKTLSLVEQQRAALTSNAAMLIDSRGARLSDTADHLARLIAQMIGDVRASDAVGARSHLAMLPIFDGQNKR